VPLADILSALQRDGDAEVANITAARDQAVSEIGREAKEIAEGSEADAATSRDAALGMEMEVIRNRATLHVERRLSEAREVIFKEILGRAQDRLGRLRGDPSYPAIQDALVAECLAFLGEVEVVMTDPHDVDLVRAALARHEVEAKVEASLEAWGGVIATDGKGVFVRNTLEERLGRAEAELRRRIGDQVPSLRGGTEPRGVQ